MLIVREEVAVVRKILELAKTIPQCARIIGGNCRRSHAEAAGIRPGALIAWNIVRGIVARRENALQPSTGTLVAGADINHHGLEELLDVICLAKFVTIYKKKGNHT